MSLLKVVGVIFVLAVVFIVIIVLFFPGTILVETPVAITETATTTNAAISNASTEFEISPGTTRYLPMTIDGQFLSVKATNKLYQVFGVTFTPPAINFTEACKIAYKAANLNKFNEVILDYKSEKMTYIVSGYAKDSFYGFDTENYRIITLTDGGSVVSITKEPAVFSFFKSLFSSTFKTWQR